MSACLARELVPHAGAYDADIELRPVEAGDTPAVLEVFAGLGPRSRELRFLSAKPRLTSADLSQLTAVDQHDHVAILAVAQPERRLVGIARFVREASRPETADVALAVVDDWQSRGIGTRLVSALVARAREVGVRRFTMAMSVGNEAALRLLGATASVVEQLDVDAGVAEYAVDLDSVD